MNGKRKSSALAALACAAVLGVTAPVLAAEDRPGDEWIEQMQGHMQRMQTIMSEYWQARDPAERQRLAEAHQQEMLAGMALMQQQGGTVGCPGGPAMMMYGGGPGMMYGGGPGSMYGPGMMYGGRGMMYGQAGRGGPGMMYGAEAPAARIDAIEKRLDAIQSSLDALVRQGAAQ